MVFGSCLLGQRSGQKSLFDLEAVIVYSCGVVWLLFVMIVVLCILE